MWEERGQVSMSKPNSTICGERENGIGKIEKIKLDRMVQNLVILGQFHQICKEDPELPQFLQHRLVEEG